jgi:hypothetical protein
MKPTASIYLHCDPTASHYLKMLMDADFLTEASIFADRKPRPIVAERSNQLRLIGASVA